MRKTEKQFIADAVAVLGEYAGSRALGRYFGRDEKAVRLWRDEGFVHHKDGDKAKLDVAQAAEHFLQIEEDYDSVLEESEQEAWASEAADSISDGFSAVWNGIEKPDHLTGAQQNAVAALMATAMDSLEYAVLDAVIDAADNLGQDMQSEHVSIAIATTLETVQSMVFDMHEQGVKGLAPRYHAPAIRSA